MNRWFLDRPGFERHLPTGCAVDELIAAAAIPGAIYGRTADGRWWSALSTPAADRAAIVAASVDLYHAPAAIWWARRAILAARAQGGNAADAATTIRAHFHAGFTARVATDPLAPYAFPHCFPAGRFDSGATDSAAAAEWNSWIDGSYGVCLRRFSAEACVRKEALRHRARAHLEGTGPPLSPQALFDVVEELEALLLPFAPEERPNGTPGRVIDRALAALALGGEHPYAD
ncbi:hypothetical protein ETR14_06410 [Sphingosinicella sp. BN140058]|nr:hypothetical protein ETR14_06410 [Sphingosinicella sp. BN140058]